MTTTATKPRIYTGESSPVDDYFNPQHNPVSVQNSDRAQENWGLFDKNNKQHLTLLSQLRTLQWTISSTKWGEVADLERLSEFLKSDKSPINHPLKKMDTKEVSKIIECFKSMITKKYK